MFTRHTLALNFGFLFLYRMETDKKCICKQMTIKRNENRNKNTWLQRVKSKVHIYRISGKNIIYTEKYNYRLAEKHLEIQLTI